MALVCFPPPEDLQVRFLPPHPSLPPAYPATLPQPVQNPSSQSRANDVEGDRYGPTWQERRGSSRNWTKWAGGGYAAMSLDGGALQAQGSLLGILGAPRIN